MSENIENTDSVSKYIIAQIVLYAFFTLSFFLIVYENRWIYFFSLLGFFALFIYLFSENYKKKKELHQVVYYFLIISIMFLILLPINIFYLLLGELFFKDVIGLDSNFNLIFYGYWFFWLFIFSLISEFIILIYMYKTKAEVSQGYGIWDYFTTNVSVIKILLLITLLLLASIAEEIIFRFFAINFLLKIGTNELWAVIITSLAFGLAHYNNGGWVYCINSTFAGFIFALAFIQMGIITAWFLHFLWNFVVVFQMFLEKFTETKIN